MRIVCWLLLVVLVVFDRRAPVTVGGTCSNEENEVLTLDFYCGQSTPGSSQGDCHTAKFEYVTSVAPGSSDANPTVLVVADPSDGSLKQIKMGNTVVQTWTSRNSLLPASAIVYHPKENMFFVAKNGQSILSYDIYDSGSVTEVSRYYDYGNVVSMVAHATRDYLFVLDQGAGKVLSINLDSSSSSPRVLWGGITSNGSSYDGSIRNGTQLAFFANTNTVLIADLFYLHQVNTSAATVGSNRSGWLAGTSTNNGSTSGAATGTYLGQVTAVTVVQGASLNMTTVYFACNVGDRLRRLHLGMVLPVFLSGNIGVKIVFLSMTMGDTELLWSEGPSIKRGNLSCAGNGGGSMTFAPNNVTTASMALTPSPTTNTSAPTSTSGASSTTSEVTSTVVFTPIPSTTTTDAPTTEESTTDTATADPSNTGGGAPTSDFSLTSDAPADTSTTADTTDAPIPTVGDNTREPSSTRPPEPPTSTPRPPRPTATNDSLPETTTTPTSTVASDTTSVPPTSPPVTSPPPPKNTTGDASIVTVPFPAYCIPQYPTAPLNVFLPATLGPCCADSVPTSTPWTLRLADCRRILLACNASRTAGAASSCCTTSAWDTECFKPYLGCLVNASVDTAVDSCAWNVAFRMTFAYTSRALELCAQSDACDLGDTWSSMPVYQQCVAAANATASSAGCTCGASQGYDDVCGRNSTLMTGLLKAADTQLTSVLAAANIEQPRAVMGATDGWMLPLTSIRAFPQVDTSNARRQVVDRCSSICEGVSSISAPAAAGACGACSGATPFRSGLSQMVSPLALTAPSASTCYRYPFNISLCSSSPLVGWYATESTLGAAGCIQPHPMTQTCGCPRSTSPMTFTLLQWVNATSSSAKWRNGTVCLPPGETAFIRTQAGRCIAPLGKTSLCSCNASGVAAAVIGVVVAGAKGYEEASLFICQKVYPDSSLPKNGMAMSLVLHFTAAASLVSGAPRMMIIAAQAATVIVAASDSTSVLSGAATYLQRSSLQVLCPRANPLSPAFGEETRVVVDAEPNIRWMWAITELMNVMEADSPLPPGSLIGHIVAYVAIVGVALAVYGVLYGMSIHVWPVPSENRWTPLFSLLVSRPEPEPTTPKSCMWPVVLRYATDAWRRQVLARLPVLMVVGTAIEAVHVLVLLAVTKTIAGDAPPAKKWQGVDLVAPSDLVLSILGLLILAVVWAVEMFVHYRAVRFAAPRYDSKQEDTVTVMTLSTVGARRRSTISFPTTQACQAELPPVPDTASGDKMPPLALDTPNCLAGAPPDFTMGDGSSSGPERPIVINPRSYNSFIDEAPKRTAVDPSYQFQSCACDYGDIGGCLFPTSFWPRSPLPVIAPSTSLTPDRASLLEALQRNQTWSSMYDSYKHPVLKAEPSERVDDDRPLTLPPIATPCGAWVHVLTTGTMPYIMALMCICAVVVSTHSLYTVDGDAADFGCRATYYTFAIALYLMALYHAVERPFRWLHDNVCGAAVLILLGNVVFFMTLASTTEQWTTTMLRVTLTLKQENNASLRDSLQAVTQTSLIGVIIVLLINAVCSGLARWWESCVAEPAFCKHLSDELDRRHRIFEPHSPQPSADDDIFRKLYPVPSVSSEGSTIISMPLWKIGFMNDLRMPPHPTTVTAVPGAVDLDKSFGTDSVLDGALNEFVEDMNNGSFRRSTTSPPPPPPASAVVNADGFTPMDRFVVRQSTPTNPRCGPSPCERSPCPHTHPFAPM